ncbi:MAG: DNA polymerase I [Candidatus Babeliales bacterium]
MNLDPKKTVYLIDGSSFLYRAYYGVRPLHTAKGVPVQAVYSFVRMIKKLIDTFKPEHIAIVWDSRGKTTRHEMYQEYKATRQAPPSDIFEQKEYIVKFAKMIGMRQIAQQGIEADDIMYSIAQEQKQAGKKVVLITSDKDMGQAIENEKIVIFDPWKDQIFNEEIFGIKMGLPVAKLPIYFAILGDASDNIPGVKGIGDKGAAELARQFNSMEDLYANIDKVSKERMRAALLANKEDAFLSYQLFLLQYHPSGFSDQDLAFNAHNWVNARPLFAELEFRSLLKDVDAQENVQRGIVPEVAQKMAGYTFITILSTDQLENLINLIKQRQLVAIDTETTSVDPMLKNSCIGISFCVQEGIAYYLPFGHKIVPQLSQDYIVKMLQPVFADEQITKIFHNAKFDLESLQSIGIETKGHIDDTLIAANLITKDWQRNGLKYLSEHYFGEPMLSYQEVVKDNKYKNFSYVPLELATQYAAADAHQTFRLKPLLDKELKQEKLIDLYQDMELPLMKVLYEMEVEGINLDVTVLKELGQVVEHELTLIMDKVSSLVGMSKDELNLNSPKQVEQLLFVKLLLPPQKKSAKRTGYSTDAEVLQVLSKMHPVPALIAKYRELSKLKSTYIDVLPEYINPHTSKIHTSFSQTQVATGRLSSSEPNMQNIPTLTEYGKEIRAAFVPKQGHLFLSADYSQIELRVLAYLSQDPALLAAFAHNRDIHTETAARLFDISSDQVTSEQRNLGKRINFSVLYGMTPFGLSQDLGIPFGQAKEYIDKYFAQYPKVMQWMEQVIVDTKHNGYVTTLAGRRRYIPAIYEKNRSLYEEARRVAINTVAQGTAAEIMKKGMITLDALFKEKHLGAKMILQIHDELIISVPEQELQIVEKLVKDTLEHVVDWNVPLVVNTRAGKNWKEITK